MTVHEHRRPRRGVFARAVGGPCHDERWEIPDGDAPPLFQRRSPVGPAFYRLLRRAGSDSPAVDDNGDYVYVPIHDSHLVGRVLPFPGGGRPNRPRHP